MIDPLLEIKNLQVSINDNKILNDLNLTINKGEIHAIMGPNGSGKSTFSKVLAGHPSYLVKNGEILFKGSSILNLDPEERSHLGIFLAFQYPVEIPGVSNEDFLRLAYNSKQKFSNKLEVDPLQFLAIINEKLKLVNMAASFLSRNVNEGFSGGEKKRNEILQMVLLDSDLSILDETDFLFKLLQLLSFIRVEQLQPDKTETLLEETYFSLIFPLHKFIKFIGMDAPGGTGQARRIKVKQSLLSLAQVKPLVNDFSFHQFESYPIIGPLKVQKQGRFLIVRMSILKQIYDYQYPFLLPRSFLSYTNRYDLYIKIEILRVLAVKDRKKILHLDNFLNNFSVSNTKKKEMKILLVTYLNQLKEFFEPTFVILNKNGEIFQTNKLTLNLIKKAKIIHFSEVISL